MRNNKVTTYLLYAIGEIILVVIGILIAVYLDNWNQQNKQNELAEKYKVQLKEDLQNDTAYFNNYLKYVVQERKYLDSLKKKASLPGTNFDTLKFIARNFNFYLSTYSGVNEGTYNTIEAAGNWEVFQDDFVKDITGLKLIQKRASNRLNLQLQVFLDRQLSHGLRYPNNPPFMFLGTGPFNDYLWEDIPTKQFVVSLNNVVTAKSIYMREALNNTTRLKSFTETILNKYFNDI